MRAFLLALTVVACTATAQDLSGLHDFDQRFGEWQVHHRRLQERLAGSHDWEVFDGTQTVWPLMGGGANTDDNVFNMPGGTYRGVSLRSYDPQTGLWAIWWLDGRNPFNDLDPPVKGRFENGVGLFYADDTLRGKPIRVRYTWSNMTAIGAHWEQAFSADGGQTWETNWVTDFKRAPPRVSGVHDFDFLVGDWQVHHRRLKARLAGSTEWSEFDGTQSTRLALDGAGNVSDNWFDIPGNAYRGVSVRSFDAKTRMWAIWWLDGRDPLRALDPPLKGRFENAGTFYADDTLNGRPIRVRYIWSQITPTSAHWEQAFSPDGGQTWETNWVSDFSRRTAHE